jgi:triosephosphate isomerase
MSRGQSEVNCHAKKPGKKKGYAMRVPILAGNWKMNLGTVDEAMIFLRQIRHPLNEIAGVEKVICPPFTVLSSLHEALLPTSIRLGAQNMHWEEKGAVTGEISPLMLASICQYVIVGHSERRAMGGKTEDDQAVQRKVQAALAHGLMPIICVGENLEQNEAGETEAFVSGQVQSALEGLSPNQAGRCVIAYEPIWAIGTGRSAAPSDANRVIGLTIRGTLARMFDESTAQAVRVQYGGSVNVGNISEFMAMPEVDGALVGGASIKPDFVELVRRGALAK